MKLTSRSFRYRRKTFIYTCVIILFLSVGIGVVAAFFESAYTLLIKPFSFDRDNRLLMLYQPLAPSSAPFMVSHPDMISLREQSRLLESIAVYQESDKTMDVSGIKIPLAGVAVDDKFLPMLGVTPALGREFTAADELKNSPNVAILSHALWAGQFGEDREIIGRAILLNNNPYTVIGVMPAGFSFLSENTLTEDVWLPLRSGTGSRENHDKSAIIRIKPGVSLEQAQAELQVIAANIGKAYPDEKGYYFTLRSFRGEVLGELQSVAWVLGLLSCGMLLIICVNVVGLCLVEAQSMRGEVELRTALGGTRRQIAIPFLQRAGLRAVLGAGGGVAVSALLLRILRAALPAGLPGVDLLHVDGLLLSFAVCTAGAAALVFGAWPTWAITKRLQQIVFRSDSQGGERSGIAGMMWRSRTMLVVVQTALSALFLTTAILLCINLWKMLEVDPGFEQAGRMVLTVRPATDKPEENADALRRFYTPLEEKLAAQPGVLAIAITTNPPMGWSSNHDFRIKNFPTPKNTLEWTANSNVISNNYLKLMHMAVHSGRAFSPDDRFGAPPVALVNDAFAKKFFPGQSPLHHYICAGEGAEPVCPWREIVGVLADVRDDRAEAATKPAYYVPWEQAVQIGETPTFVIESVQSVEGMTESLRRTAQANAPGALVFGPETILARRQRQLAFPRYRSVFALTAAILAMFFATTGLYGLIAASLLQRRREIAVRLAVGATYSDIYLIFLRKTMKWTLPAAIAGILGATVLISVYGSLIGGVSSVSLSAYAASFTALMVAAILATVLPVRRALYREAMYLLRTE